MDIKMAKYREYLRDLTLFDDELMSLAFQDDCAFTEFLLNAICPHAGFKVKAVKSQLSLYNVMGRSLRLDILADDALGRKVNIEVQQLPQGAVPMRARFHASLLDTHVLDKGKEFGALPTTYIIFITKTDVLGRGKPIYTIRRYIEETDELFDDRSIIIYVNGACINDTELGQIMHDFQCASPDKMKSKTVASKLKNVKNVEEDKRMGALFDAIYEEGHEIGEQKGKHHTYARMIHKHMLKTQCSLDEAFEWFEVPEEDIGSVSALVLSEIDKEKNRAQEQSRISTEKVKNHVEFISKYMQKTGCTLSEALNFFDIPESDGNEIIAWMNPSI